MNIKQIGIMVFYILILIVCINRLFYAKTFFGIILLVVIMMAVCDIALTDLGFIKPEKEEVEE